MTTEPKVLLNIDRVYSTDGHANTYGIDLMSPDERGLWLIRDDDDGLPRFALKHEDMVEMAHAILAHAISREINRGG